MLSVHDWERRCDESAVRSHERRNGRQRHEALLILAVLALVAVMLLVGYT